MNVIKEHPICSYTDNDKKLLRHIQKKMYSNKLTLNAALSTGKREKEGDSH